MQNVRQLWLTDLMRCRWWAHFSHPSHPATQGSCIYSAEQPHAI